MKSASEKKQNIFLRIALAALLVWMVISLIQLQIEIDGKRSQYDEQLAEHTVLERTYHERTSESKDKDSQLEEQAHNSGWSNQGEIFYKEVPGS